MPDQGAPLVSLTAVQKNYGGLRPLRIKQLDLRDGQTVAVVGVDQAMAEVLVNLIVGANVPDAGEVRAFDRLTTSITDGDVWLRSLDDFGILTERALLMDQMTAEQNLTLPLSLDFHDVPADVRTQVARLAAETGITAAELATIASVLPPLVRARLRLGRALAMNPRVLLAEHPNASIPPDDVPTFAADFSRIVRARGVATLVLTADPTFAAAVAEQVLTFYPATGELKGSVGWRRWFS